MPKGDAEWQALQDGIDAATPACVHDLRFVMDDDQIKAAELAGVCDSCPLLDLCAAYGKAARPTGGVWAGKRWHRATTTKEPK
jgi:hypothetical protein